MRTFIAIELPEQIKHRLAELQTKLKESNTDVKWVNPENIHLTLKFLGEIDAVKSNQIIKVITEISSSFTPFQVSLANIGAFPKIEFARVIWVAIDTGNKEVKLLAQQLEERLDKLGIPKEDRPFSSHITIGRVRSGKNSDKLAKSLKESEDYFRKENIEFTATGITLFKSTLSSSGPSYEALQIAKLATA